MSSLPLPFAIPSSPTDSPAPQRRHPPSLQTHRPKRPFHGHGPLLRTPSAGLSPSYSPALPDADEQTPLLHRDSRSESQSHTEGDVEAGEKRQLNHRILAWTMRITVLFFLSFLPLDPHPSPLNWAGHVQASYRSAGCTMDRFILVGAIRHRKGLIRGIALKAGIGEEGSKAEVEAYDLSAAVYLSGQSEGTNGKEVASLRLIDLRVEVTTGSGAEEAIEEVAEVVKRGGGNLKGRVVGKRGGVKFLHYHYFQSQLRYSGWFYDFKMVNSTKGTDTQLQSLGLDSSMIKEKLISLTARGILLNPLHPSTNFSRNLPPFLRNLQSLRFDVPWTFPFGVYYPIPSVDGHSVPDFLLALVATIPFTFDNSQKEINLTISSYQLLWLKYLHSKMFGDAYFGRRHPQASTSAQHQNSATSAPVQQMQTFSSQEDELEEVGVRELKCELVSRDGYSGHSYNWHILG
ncbi:hypothetical protein BT69DRAFT_1358365 [Atractiella rhizophila]|nr:hypothetical protein BT69DRAFT_1358365 [Atractiella rhizophila]